MLNGIIKKILLYNNFHKKKLFTLGIIDLSNNLILYNGLQKFLCGEDNNYSLEIEKVVVSDAGFELKYHSLVHKLFYKTFAFSNLINQNRDNLILEIQNFKPNSLIFIISNESMVHNGIWGQMDILFQLFNNLDAKLSFFIETNFTNVQLDFLLKHNTSNLSFNQMIHSYIYSPSILFHKELQLDIQLFDFFTNINRFLQVENFLLKHRLLEMGEAFIFVNNNKEKLEYFIYHCNKILYTT